MARRSKPSFKDWHAPGERFKIEHRDPRSAVVVGQDTSTPASRLSMAQEAFLDAAERHFTRDLPGLRILTEHGWQLIGGPLKPAPFIEDQGQGVRMTVRGKS